MNILDIKLEFAADCNKIESMKKLLEKLQSVGFFEEANICDYTSGSSVCLDKGETGFLNDAWSEEINTLIDEIAEEEKRFVEKWGITR